MLSRQTLATLFVGLCTFFAWFIALSRLLFVDKFYDRAFALESTQNLETPFFEETFIKTISTSYYQRKYLFFAPHVAAAISWWNLSPLQMIQNLRRKYKWFHRWNGRLQMVALLIQIVTGTLLGLTAETTGVMWLSVMYGVAMAFVTVKAWWAAWTGDIVRHKYWATKLFGYSQAQGLQRVMTFVFSMMLMYGVWPYTYKDWPEDQKSPEAATRVFAKLFDDTFSTAIYGSIVLTEWYQSVAYEEELEARKQKTVKSN
uniref:Uncharacterized protein n=1 Tax=Chromera velia CCMP2878 TaxID=1169474 RepID=A0A0G4FD50_9ALVE|eukprot:Cvel_16414.t1-p1 / transcript=Cvel_16414.t1 / gene=Cvel_16414 / organism=Chromera_velia_CCMP2878 / gene_product=hypothetical protein / transcript_product=hypothetical protein / location=Cvel_scaffold1263:45384-46154(+) / protein_length=257 / sequence_SO=supercontig / SO=protein_coding / is_pseudo=false